jgi:hypothetical protein
MKGPPCFLPPLSRGKSEGLRAKGWGTFPLGMDNNHEIRKGFLTTERVMKEIKVFSGNVKRLQRRTFKEPIGFRRLVMSEDSGITKKK